MSLINFEGEINYPLDRSIAMLFENNIDKLERTGIFNFKDNEYLREINKKNVSYKVHENIIFSLKNNKEISEFLFQKLVNTIISELTITKEIVKRINIYTEYMSNYYTVTADFHCFYSEEYYKDKMKQEHNFIYKKIEKILEAWKKDCYENFGHDNITQSESWENIYHFYNIFAKENKRILIEFYGKDFKINLVNHFLVGSSMEYIIDRVLERKNQDKLNEQWCKLIFEDVNKVLTENDKLIKQKNNVYLVRCNKINKKLFSPKWCINYDHWFFKYNSFGFKQYIYIDKNLRQWWGFSAYTDEDGSININENTEAFDHLNNRVDLNDIERKLEAFL